MKYLTYFIFCSSLACGQNQALNRASATKIITDSQVFKSKAPEHESITNPHPSVKEDCSDVIAGIEITGLLVRQKLVTVQLPAQWKAGWQCALQFSEKIKPLVGVPEEVSLGAGEKRYPILVAHRELVEVTGITDALDSSDGKMVQFQWRFVPEPALAGVDMSKLGNGPDARNGWAILRLYDDGWRVSRVNLGRIGE